MTAPTQVYVCTSTDGCKSASGHYMLRLDHAEVQRLKAHKVNVFMDSVPCAIYPGIYHVKDFTL